MLTGQLGDVMKESAQAALSYVKSHLEELGIEKNIMEGHDIHIHVPAGAIPKDGPSAGVSMLAALVSLLTRTCVRPDVAMTGEITLRGLVLPVGGIKEKMLAAHRAGIKRIVLPERNDNGEPCNQPDACIEGQRCNLGDDDKCFKLSAEGQPCNSNLAVGPCLRVDNFCDATSKMGVKLPRVGQPCAQVGVDEDLARGVALLGAPPGDPLRLDHLEQPAQRAVDVADELHLRPVARVDLGRLRVDVDDPLLSVRVPAARAVLDEVVPDADDDIRPVEAGQHVIAGLEPHGKQRQVGAVVDRALAHERGGDRDVEAPREGAQLLGGAPPQDPVAGQDERPRGPGDQRGACSCGS
jgi:hypothetical protein